MSAGSEMVSAVKDESCEPGVCQFIFVVEVSECFFHFLGIQLHQASTVDIKTVDNKASITLRAAHKEHEGVYTIRLRTRNENKEHSAFVYVSGESQHESGFDFNTVPDLCLLLIMWNF